MGMMVKTSGYPHGLDGEFGVLQNNDGYARPLGGDAILITSNRLSRDRRVVLRAQDGKERVVLRRSSAPGRTHVTNFFLTPGGKSIGVVVEHDKEDRTGHTASPPHRVHLIEMKSGRKWSFAGGAANPTKGGRVEIANYGHPRTYVPLAAFDGDPAAVRQLARVEGDRSTLR
jgi:hypothetical protein